MGSSNKQLRVRPVLVTNSFVLLSVKNFTPNTEIRLMGGGAVIPYLLSKDGSVIAIRVPDLPQIPIRGGELGYWFSIRSESGDKLGELRFELRTRGEIQAQFDKSLDLLK